MRLNPKKILLSHTAMQGEPRKNQSKNRTSRIGERSYVPTWGMDISFIFDWNTVMFFASWRPYRFWCSPIKIIERFIKSRTRIAKDFSPLRFEQENPQIGGNHFIFIIGASNCIDSYCMEKCNIVDGFCWLWQHLHQFIHLFHSSTLALSKLIFPMF